MDHVDGNRKNDKRGNLRLLFHNCHTQTENYARCFGEAKERMLSGFRKYSKSRGVGQR